MRPPPPPGTRPNGPFPQAPTHHFPPKTQTNVQHARPRSPAKSLHYPFPSLSGSGRKPWALPLRPLQETVKFVSELLQTDSDAMYRELLSTTNNVRGDIFTIHHTATQVRMVPFLTSPRLIPSPAPVQTP